MNALAPIMPNEPSTTFYHDHRTVGLLANTAISPSELEAGYRDFRVKFARHSSRPIKAQKGGSAIFSNQIAIEPKSGTAELADRQADKANKRIAAQKSVEKRLEELKTIAAEEGYSVLPASERALRAFMTTKAVMKQPYLSLLDNGNVRALWENRANGEQIGLQFLGGDQVQYVIFARRAEGFVARSAGRDLVTNVDSQIEANGLFSLMA